MKRQIKYLVALALIAILPLGSLLAQQQQPPQPPKQEKGQGKFPGRQKFLQELNLSQDQKDQIQKLRTDHQKQMVDFRSEIAKTRIDIKNLFTGNNPDEGKILDLTKKVSDIQSDMKASSIKNWFQIYNLLNDQQKATFRKMAPAMLHERMGEGRGGRGMMGKGMMGGKGMMRNRMNRMQKDNNG